MHVVEYFSVDYRTFPSMHILYTLFYIQNNALAVAVDALVVGVPRTSQGQPGTFNFMLRCL